MKVIKKSEIQNYFHKLCRIDIYEVLNGIRTSITGFVVGGTEIDWEKMMKIMKQEIGCEVGTNSLDDSTILFGGDYREKVKELLLKYKMFEERQIGIVDKEETNLSRSSNNVGKGEINNS